MTTVTLEKLTKVYANGVVALSGLDLHVDDGEFVVLVGPSGCGKTTALRMVAGLEEITSGILKFGDRVVNDVSPRDRDAAMVFQNYALYPHLSVYENIGFSLEMRKVPKADRDAKIRDAAAALGLTDMLNRKPRQLSGGQRQRVAMGRAIVREPSVFLMDEPLSNLDAKLRVQMRSEVLRVHRRLAVATLYVTHDQTEAMTMGDRVVVLRDGVLQQYAAPRDLYQSPTNLFVATFIGSPSMNVYQGALEPAGDGATVVLGSQRLSLPASVLAGRPSLRAYLGRKLVVGLRPEHISDPALAAQPPAPGTTLVADVDLVEALGSEELAHFTIDAPTAQQASKGDADDAAEAIGGIVSGGSGSGIARLDPLTAIRSGARATFAIHIDGMRFFDTETGEAI
jgi:multiple sugar transport system ATP-binding protein